VLREGKGKAHRVAEATARACFHETFPIDLGFPPFAGEVQVESEDRPLKKGDAPHVVAKRFGAKEGSSNLEIRNPKQLAAPAGSELIPQPTSLAKRRGLQTETKSFGMLPPLFPREGAASDKQIRWEAQPLSPVP
jgi:hypothetical protein